MLLISAVVLHDRSVVGGGEATLERSEHGTAVFGQERRDVQV